MLKYDRDEINCLEYYTSRKANKYLDYEMINQFLKFLSNPNDINFTSSEWLYVNPNQISLIFESIEKLYCLCCKYGNVHTIPKIIYRQEHHWNNILDHMDIYSNLWVTESFLSFTKDKDEVDRFKYNEDCVLLTGFTKNSLTTGMIPFIDVTDVLGVNPYLRDEKEIIIPPFSLVQIVSTDSYNINLLSKDLINVTDFSQEMYYTLLEKFIETYREGNCIQFNEVRKQLNVNFSKKLLKEKLKIIS